MEFSYRISEAECWKAWRLFYETTSGIKTVKAVLLWLAIFVSLILVFWHIHRCAQLLFCINQVKSEFFVFISPGIFVFCVWIYLTIGFEHKELHRLCKKDPLMQGQYTVNITPESISTQNTAGLSSTVGWNIFDYWLEGKGFILLVFHSGSYFLLSLSGLSEPQQYELRSILTAALPKK
jgi:hypothetical protein